MEHDDGREIAAMEKARKKWNAEYRNYGRREIKYDDWLDLFKRAIENCQTPIVELGCGKGKDTLYLVEKGKKVIPCDYSSSAIENIQKNFPEVERAECFDMTKGLPFEDNFTDLIVCGLSLHYFTERTTFKILEEIKRVLKPKGILLFRVNSTKDVNYGAGEGKEIEHHLYETDDGRHKRFFDKDDLEKFFADWETIYMQEETIVYEKSIAREGIVGNYENEKKVLWRCAMQVKK